MVYRRNPPAGIFGPPVTFELLVGVARGGHISLAQFFEQKENPTVEATAENKNDYTIV